MRKFITWLIFDKNQLWLHLIIDILCQIEMYMKILFDNLWFDNLSKQSNYNIVNSAREFIPRNTMYCEDCPFIAKSALATFFFGEQCNGYCYFLGRGDFSFVSPTTILWDGCKECGLYEDMEFVNEI